MFRDITIGKVEFFKKSLWKSPSLPPTTKNAVTCARDKRYGPFSQRCSPRIYIIISINLLRMVANNIIVPSWDKYFRRIRRQYGRYLRFSTRVLVCMWWRFGERTAIQVFSRTTQKRTIKRTVKSTLILIFIQVIRVLLKKPCRYTISCRVKKLSHKTSIKKQFENRMSIRLF